MTELLIYPKGSSIGWKIRKSDKLTLDKSKIILKMVQELIIIVKVMCIMVNGKKIKWKGKALIYLRMETFIQVLFIEGSNMEKVSTSIGTVIHMLGNGLMI